MSEHHWPEDALVIPGDLLVSLAVTEHPSGRKRRRMPHMQDRQLLSVRPHHPPTGAPNALGKVVVLIAPAGKRDSKPPTSFQVERVKKTSPPWPHLGRSLPAAS